MSFFEGSFRVGISLQTPDGTCSPLKNWRLVTRLNVISHQAGGKQFIIRFGSISHVQRSFRATQFGSQIARTGQADVTVRRLQGFDDFDFALFAEDVDVDAAAVAVDEDVACSRRLRSGFRCGLLRCWAARLGLVKQTWRSRALTLRPSEAWSNKYGAPAAQACGAQATG